MSPIQTELRRLASLYATARVRRYAVNMQTSTNPAETPDSIEGKCSRADAELMAYGLKLDAQIEALSDQAVRLQAPVPDRYREVLEKRIEKLERLLALIVGSVPDDARTDNPGLGTACTVAEDYLKGHGPLP